MYPPKVCWVQLVLLVLQRHCLCNKRTYLCNQRNCFCKESACVDHGEVLDPIVLSLEQHLTSKVFIRLNIFFCIFSFWANFYVGTATTQLGDMKIVPFYQMSEYGDKLTILMTAGVLVIPIVGWLMDYCGYPVTMLVTIVFAIIWAFIICLKSPTYIYASFVAYALFRTFLYTFLFLNIRMFRPSYRFQLHV